MPLTLNGTTGIVTGNLADAAVTTPKIADSAVVTADIANGAVTAEKLSGGQTGSAPVYGCRAWVNFDGTRNAAGGTDTANTNRFIRSSGNVASVLRNAVGDYTVNFATPMADANYAAFCHAGTNGVNSNSFQSILGNIVSQTSSSVRFSSSGDYPNASVNDKPFVSVTIFGN